MLTHHIAFGLVTAALFYNPALAQTSTAPGSTAPGVQSSATQASSAASSARLGTSQFLSSVSGDQVRFSKLKGLDVYGPNNEKIGDLRDVLLAHDGKAEAAVIGVGGFLGVGEKEVAVPFSTLQWRDRPAGAAGTSSSGQTAAPPASSNAPAGTSVGSAATREGPDHAVLDLTKTDLQNAPAFRYVGSADNRPSSVTAPAGSTNPPPASK